MPRRGEHRVAIGQARGQRLFDQHVHAGLGRRDRRPGVQRVRVAMQDGLDAALVEHRGDVGVRAERR